MADRGIIELTAAVETLVSQLTAAVAELQVRKEESDHIHDLLLTRAEKAAMKIVSLEKRVAELEDDREADESELKSLRIQLRAIEVQAAAYVTQNEDPELSESIRNWKKEWEDIDMRYKARRKKRQVSMDALDDLRTAVDGS